MITQKTAQLALKNLPLCPLCGSAQRRKCYLLEATAVYRCTACSLAYLDPCLDPEGMAKIYESSESLKEVHDFHEGYYEYGDLEKNSRTLKEFCQSLEAAERQVSCSERKLFEVGYGNGLFLALAKKRGWQVDGIDTSPLNLETAKKRFGLNLQAGYFEGTEKKESASWDTVAMLDVIEHISEPYPFLKKAREILKPGGVLLLGTPNQASFFTKLAHIVWMLSGGLFRAGIDKIYFLEHVTYYDRKTLGLLLTRAGFEPVASFCSETDLAKYRLKPLERFVGEIILFFGRIFRSGNRLIMIAKKKG